MLNPIGRCSQALNRRRRPARLKWLNDHHDAELAADIVDKGIVLTGLHFLFVSQVRVFAEDRNAHPARYYRILNEMPTLLMIVIVIMVIVKPL